MKIIIAFLLLMGLSLSVCSKPIIIGKDQAPINAHDYAVLKKVAENAQFPIEKFRHYKRNHYIIDKNGFLYWDEKKMESLMVKMRKLMEECLEQGIVI